MKRWITCILGLCSQPLLAAPAAVERIPAQTCQLLVTVAADWNSAHGQMYRFSRAKASEPWKVASAKPTAVMLGRAGLAWGRGLLPVPHGENGIPSKRERDTRSPAGCFQLGTLYGYAPQAPANVSLPYYQVTARDCWIDDSASPQYNQHVAVDLTAPPAWYEQQKMRLGDFAYEWMLEIQHNTAPAKSQAGSAIFFHIRRGADKPTHGCTSMEKTSLVSLLGWLQPMAQPLYVLLPITEYQHRIKSWALPALPE